MEFNLTKETDALSDKIKEIQKYILEYKKENNLSCRLKIKLRMDICLPEDESSDKKSIHKNKIPYTEFSFQSVMLTHDGKKVYLPKVVVNSNKDRDAYTTMSFLHRLNHYHTLKYVTESIQKYLSSNNMLVEIIDIPESDRRLISSNSSIRVFYKEMRK